MTSPDIFSDQKGVNASRPGKAKFGDRAGYQVKRSSEKAVMVENNGQDVWVPKSQAELTSDGGFLLSITDWLASKEENKAKLSGIPTCSIEQQCRARKEINKANAPFKPTDKPITDWDSEDVPY